MNIPGQPILTGSLPRTRLVVRQSSAVVKDRSRWPAVPDPEAVTYDRMRPGMVASVRTRLGVRTWLVRTVGRSRGGRRYFTGMNRAGWCHSAWLSQVISIETLHQHRRMASVIDARIREENR